nr:Rne/Rng family ribonuclease [Actinomyces minihominis]
MRRREGRKEGRRRHSITEAEFLARRESVDREMIVRHEDGSDQVAVLEDGILVEHFVARRTSQSVVGNIYLGKVQNVLPSMEAAFVDIGRGRNAVLYAGEVNWDALGMQGKPRRIESALAPGDNVLVQVTKDPIGHKGARLTSQITLAGRYLVLVPGSTVLGISRKLPEPERNRLKKILKQIVPEGTGVIVRTASEGAAEDQLRDDVDRLTKQWAKIEKKTETTRKAPVLLRGEPEMVVRVVRDLFNEDVAKLVVQGEETWQTVHEYVEELSPELLDRLEKWNSKSDVFDEKGIRPQLAKGMDRKVWLPSGGTLIIERTEAMTVVDVNTGKFVGSGGTLEETVTRNNLEAAEEIVRQLRLRDIGGIIIIDFVDMVLEANRELVLRRLVESLGRDRTRHQVTEITSLGLVQMTRKRVGEGLVETFSTSCEACEGRGFIVHDHPVEADRSFAAVGSGSKKKQRGGDQQRQGDERRHRERQPEERATAQPVDSHIGEEKVKSALTAIAAATVAVPPADPAADFSGGKEQTAESSPRKTQTKRQPRRAQKAQAPARDNEAESSSPAQAPPAEAKSVKGEKTKAAKSVPTAVEDIVLPTQHQVSKAVTRPVRRRAVVTGPLDPGKAATGSKATGDGITPPKGEDQRSKEESARAAVRDLLQQ